MLPIMLNSAVWLVLATSFSILLVQNWRWMLGLLAVQYVGVMGLVAYSWPLEIAVVKLVAGWMAASVLMMTHLNLPALKVDQEPLLLPGILFRGLTAVLIALSVYSLLPEALRWFLSATPQQALGGLLLLGLGLLQAGLALTGIRIVLAMLTVLSGFEILYATLEASVLMTGLLAVLQVGIAFVGAYLQFSAQLEVER
jgi:hypothetical protein